LTRSGLPGSYAGTLFRSHLEARWAIFFDRLDLKWEYEPQGFDLGGTLYLPDFAVYAACGTLWCEVKPEWDADPAGIEKWRRFAAMRPQPSRAVLLIGKPTAHGEHVVIGGLDPADTDDPLKGPWEDGDSDWRPCTAGYHFDIGCAGGDMRYSLVEDGCPQYRGADGPERIDAAIEAALSYRFGKFGPQPGKAA
jgi:hypothetical protein